MNLYTVRILILYVIPVFILTNLIFINLLESSFGYFIKSNDVEMEESYQSYGSIIQKQTIEDKSNNQETDHDTDVSSTSVGVFVFVDNERGGTAKPSDFILYVNTDDGLEEYHGMEDKAKIIELNPGDYSVKISGPFGYIAQINSQANDCTGKIKLGEQKICRYDQIYGSELVFHINGFENLDKKTSFITFQTNNTSTYEPLKISSSGEYTKILKSEPLKIFLSDSKEKPINKSIKYYGDCIQDTNYSATIKNELGQTKDCYIEFNEKEE